MNTANRTIALVDAAMRRRFAFVELHLATPPTRRLLAAWLDRLAGERGRPAEAPALPDLLNLRIEGRDPAVGPRYLMRRGIY